MRATAGLFLILLSGCSGLDIRTLNADQTASAWSDDGRALNGYVVYAPAVVVERSKQTVCLGETDETNKCSGQTAERCVLGKPFFLPDYTKPYLVSSKSGLGKAGVEVTIVSGWMLGDIKDNSDNTAILGVLSTVLDRRGRAQNYLESDCDKPGLFQVKLESGKIVMKEISFVTK